MQDDLLTPEWRHSASGAKSDRRSRRTRSQLMSALITLLKEKSLKSITVTELTEMADVNRATFYAHFRDVYDMFDQVKVELCQVFRDLVEAHADELAHERYDGLLNDLFTYFSRNDDALATVLSSNGDGRFISDVVNVFRDGCFDAIRTAGSSTPMARLIERNAALGNYHFQFIAGGVMNVLDSWVSGGRREPVAEIAAVTNEYVRVIAGGKLQENVEEALRRVHANQGEWAREGGGHSLMKTGPRELAPQMAQAAHA